MASTLTNVASSANEGNPGANGIVRFTLARTDSSVSRGYMYQVFFTGSASSSDFAVDNNPQNPNYGEYKNVFAPAGSTTFDLDIAINGDLTSETNETFTVDIFEINSNGFYNGTYVGTGTGTIINDDATPSQYSVNDVLVNEGSTTAGSTALTFTIARDNADAAGTVAYSFANLTTDAADFAGGLPASGTATFAAGVLSQLVTVNVAPDFIIENTETFTINLSGATGGTILDNQGVGTIVNDDVAGAFSVANVSITEGDTLSQTGQFIVTRTGMGIASVGYTISNGGSSNAASATAGADYAATTSGTINFAGGQTSAVVQFTVIGDTLVEGNEQFKLTLDTPTNGGTLTKQIGFATIIDNDVPAGASVQVGTAGNDTIIAQTPNAFLVGGAGNDTFLVYSEGATIIEGNGGGTDIVYTVGSYNLGNNEIEALSTAQQTDTTDINLIGNYVSQTIVGNYGNNILNGGSGADTLIGLFGNDTYVVGDSRIIIQEQTGQGTDTVVTSVNYALGAGVSIESLVVQDRASTAAINLTGNEFAQTIGGSEGANVIDGGLGADVLIGFGGSDTFAFTTELGNGNVDTIVDFASGTDKIALATGIFAAIGTTLDANEFVSGTAATTTDQHIVYNAGTGQVFYDADGSGTGAAVLFAQVAPGVVLAANDFVMVVPATAAA